MSLATIDQKRRLIQSLRQSEGKYSKPFDKGEFAMINLLGGTWNDYAQVVFNMVIADTLLDILQELREQNGKEPDDGPAPAGAWQSVG